MKVRVRLFALVKDLIGAESIELELPEGATIAALRERLIASHAQLAPLARHLLFAEDRQYVGDAVAIRPGAELACIPPVSGG